MRMSVILMLYWHMDLISMELLKTFYKGHGKMWIWGAKGPRVYQMQVTAWKALFSDGASTLFLAGPVEE